MYNSASLGHQREELVLVQNVSKPQQGSLQELLERAQQQLEALGQEEKDKLKENLQRQFDKRAQEALKEKQAALGKRMPFMNGRKFNWLVLAGFLVCVIPGYARFSVGEFVAVRTCGNFVGYRVAAGVCQSRGVPGKNLRPDPGGSQRSYLWIFRVY